MEECLCCGKLIVKNRRRFLTNKANEEWILFVLRHFYGELMVERRMRLENSEAYRMLTELHNDEFMTRVLFLCENSWKVLSNFFKKEASIKECFRLALALLPTIACREQGVRHVLLKFKILKSCLRFNKDLKIWIGISNLLKYIYFVRYSAHWCTL